MAVAPRVPMGPDRGCNSSNASIRHNTICGEYADEIDAFVFREFVGRDLARRSQSLEGGLEFKGACVGESHCAANGSNSWLGCSSMQRSNNAVNSHVLLVRGSVANRSSTDGSKRAYETLIKD